MKEDSHSITSNRTTNQDNKQESRIDLAISILKKHYNVNEMLTDQTLIVQAMIEFANQKVKESIPKILEEHLKNVVKIITETMPRNSEGVIIDKILHSDIVANVVKESRFNLEKVITEKLGL